ncbi:MAG: GntR family transcriptional regulator [Anaerolineales bacterium]|nr:GntR family transcriptional regulator [Anaerolineales bacterium]
MSWEGEINVQKDSLTPLYLQLQESLTSWIQNGLRNGSLSPGDCIPSENDLSQSLGLSSTTVKRSLEDLRRQGFIKRIQGRGSYITGQKKFEADLIHLFSLATLAQKLGVQPTQQKIELTAINASTSVAKHLRITEGAKIAKLVRARMFDQTVIALDTSYIPLSIFPGLITEYQDEFGLYDIMENLYDNSPVWAKDFIEPVLINKGESRILGVPAGSVGLLIERTAYGNDEIPIEFNKSVLRGDIFRFSMILRREDL